MRKPITGGRTCSARLRKRASAVDAREVSRMAFSFIHTADWQIGKPFANFSDDAAVPLQKQRIETVAKIASLAAQHKVDAVLVAGDVFDMNTVSEKTVRQTFNAMSGFDGHWLMLPGNHDAAVAESVWSLIRRINQKPNIHVLDTATPFEVPSCNVVVLPAPLQRRHDSTDVTQWFDGHQSEPNVFRIGLAHGSIDNRIPDRGDNAPNTIDDKRATKAKLDYLALGDWHGTQSVDARSWYSGTHETDRFKSNDSGNVLLVKLTAPGDLPLVEKIPTGHYRWRQLAPLLDPSEAVADLRKCLEELGEPFDNLVLQLAPRGSASMQVKHDLLGEIKAWEAQVHYLDFDDAGLSGQASEEDLETLGRTGFVAEAVNRLRAQAADENNPEREIAQLALDLLFMEQRELVARS